MAVWVLVFLFNPAMATVGNMSQGNVIQAESFSTSSSCQIALTSLMNINPSGGGSCIQTVEQ